MKIRHVHNSKFAKFIGYNITLYPFVLYAGVPSERTVYHEMVHVEQVQRVGWLKFYILYVYYYLKNRVNGMDKMGAYINIPYEQEAYLAEYNQFVRRKT